jgi:hypothetical protein
MYTTTVSTGLRKIERRNSNCFAPLKIALAYSGLIDNNARVRSRKREDCRELLA